MNIKHLLDSEAFDRKKLSQIQKRFCSLVLKKLNSAYLHTLLFCKKSLEKCLLII